VITFQPKDQFLALGQTARFPFSGQGAMSVQWFFNGSPMAGATTYGLTLTNVQLTQSGYYSAVLSNALGFATSQVARLKVFLTNPTPHSVSGIQPHSDGSANLIFAGDTTLPFARYYDQYLLETSSNLVDWALLQVLQRTNQEPSSFHFVDPGAGKFNQRFYRTQTNALMTPDPRPTGPYAVGTFSMLLTDPSRIDKSRHTNQQFMVTFWYPAASQTAVLPTAYVEPQVAMGQAFFNLAAYGGANFGSEVAAFFSHSVLNAPMSTNSLKYPVVLYSTGFEGHRRENTDKTEELASWGYIVVGLDNRNTFVSVFPNGTVVNGQQTGDIVGAIEDWFLDQQFVLDELGRLNTSDPRLAGRLDLDKIGAFGWSLGGPTSAQLCLRDSRCKAGVGMDGSFFESNVLARPLSVPYLFFKSDDGSDGTSDDRVLFFNEQVSNAYWVKLASTVHGDFSDPALIVDSGSLQAVWGRPVHGRLLPSARVSQIVRAYLLSFFNKFLRGEDDHLLDGPSSAYPEVIQFLKK
jgi:dienelactone hydrolase